MSLVSQRRIVQPDLTNHRSNISKQESFFEKNDDPQMDMSQSDKKHVSQYALNNGTTGGSGYVNVHHKSPVFQQLSQIVRRVRLRVIVSKLLNSTRSRMLKNMTSNQFSLISDKSQYFGDLPKDSQSHYYYQHLLHTRGVFFNQIFQIFFKTLSQIPLINPSSQIKFLWDLFIAGWMLYSLFIITVMVSFGLGESAMHTKYLFQIILLVNSVDILLTCNMGFYKKGVLCKNRSAIWKKYISDQLAIDVFSLLPISIFLMISRNLSGDNQQSSYDFTFITLSLLSRIHIIIRVKTHTSQKYILQPNLRNVLSLLSLAFKILVIIHVWTCIWIFTGRMSEQISQASWMRAIHLLDAGWEKQYLLAFYFSTLTMTTVGYGDIVPITPIETIVCLVMLLFACGVFGFSVNTIQTILADFSRNQKDISQKMFIIKNYLYTKSINPALSKDVTEYLEYFWKMHQTGNQEEEQKMVKSLSDTLRRELLIESNRIVLKDCMIFQENFSEEVIKAMIPLIKEQHFTPEEVIFDAQDDEETDHDRSIYFVSEGTVEVFLKTTTAAAAATSMTACSTAKPSNSSDIKQFKNLRRLKKGDVFGQVEFFTNLDRAMSVRSVNFSSLLCISRNDFVKMLRQFPEDYEQFQYIKDRLIQQKEFSKVHYKCNSCQSTSHNLSNCPYVHFIPNRPKILAVNNRSQIQQRNEIKVNRSLRRYSQQDKIVDVQQTAKNFQDFAEELIEEYTMKDLQFRISGCDCCDIYQEVTSAAFDGGDAGESQLSNSLNLNQGYGNNLRVGSVQLDSRALALEEYQQQQLQVNQYKAALKRHYLRNIAAAHGFYDHFTEDASPNVRSLKLTPMFNKQGSSKISSQQQQTPKQQQYSEQITSFQKETMDDNIDLGEISFPVGIENQPMALPQQTITLAVGNGNNNNKVVQQLKKEWQQSRQLGYSNQYHNIQETSSDYSLNPIQFQEQLSPLVARSYYSNHQSQCYSMNNKDCHAATAGIAHYNGGVNISNQTHKMIQIFDIFNGTFETMHVFQLYYPLNNYSVVLKQLHMDEDQKRKLRTNLIEQQRQKTINILLKKRRQHNAPRASIRSIDQSLIKRIVDKFQKDNMSNIQSNTQKEIASVSCNTSEIKRNNTGQMSKDKEKQQLQKQQSKDDDYQDGYQQEKKNKYNDKFKKQQEKQEEVSYDSDDSDENSSQSKSSSHSESKTKKQKESDKDKKPNNATQLSICSQVGFSESNILQNQRSLAHCLPSQSSNPEILGLDSLSFSMPYVLSRRNKPSPRDQQTNDNSNNLCKTNSKTLSQLESNSKNINQKGNICNSQQLQNIRHNTNPPRQDSSLSPKGDIDLYSLSSPQREQRIQSYDHDEKMIVNIQEYNQKICKQKDGSSRQSSGISSSQRSQDRKK